MRSPTRTGLLLAIAGAVVALPTVASGALPTGAQGPARVAGVAANSTTYQDSTGENPAAADITTIVVSNNDAGIIQFRINVANRPQYAPDIAVVVYLDTDANQSTGDPDSFGADHLIFLLQGEPVLLRWNGEDFDLSATQSSLSHAWSAGSTFRITAADLGNTSRFNFGVQTIAGLVFDDLTGTASCPDPDCARDFAPPIGFYPYQVIIARPTLVVRQLASAPRAPQAGKPFTLRMTAARSDTGAVIQNGRVTCQGRAGKARLRSTTARVQGGQVTCTWQIPANAKRRLFRGTVSVVFEGLRASRSFSARIR